MKSRTFVLFFALFLCLSLQAKGSADSLKVLWVGNSYTFFNDLPKMVQEIAATKKMKLSMTRFLKGGERFSGHLRNEKLIEALKQGGWDYVILQEQSSDPAQSTVEVAEKVYPAAHRLDSLAKAGSPKAHVIYYMTWGHKYGNVHGPTAYPLDDTYEMMQDRIITTYLEMAHQNNSWCAPAGMAWKKVRAEHPEYILYKPDCFHPSAVGTYLIANVIFTTIYQRHYQTDYKANLLPEQAEYLQNVAQQTVLDNLPLLNIQLSGK